MARDTSAAPPAVRIEKAIAVKQSSDTQTPKPEPAKELVKVLPVNVPPLNKVPANTSTVKAQPAKMQPVIAPAIKAQPLKVAMVKAQPALAPPVNQAPTALQPVQQVSMAMETAFTKLADGFDFPVGKPDAQGYYKARGFRSKGHLGEDWDGVRGGDTDLGDPIYCIGNGIVVFAHDCHMGWGNVIIVRHTYREGGEIRNIDSLYGHLNSMLVRRGQFITRGQQIATMGTAHGLYDAHLHLEVRKNLEIGMSRAKFARDFSNYYDPSQFIAAHRHLQASDGKYRVALNTFTYDSKINWASKRNYSGYRGGGGESAAALKRAVASQSR